MNAATPMNELFPRMVEWRRHLHRHPELSFQEAQTKAYIVRQLEQLGVPVDGSIQSGYSVVAIIEGGQPGPTIALRADIDALPIEDEKSCEYRSTAEGVMHACGHDAHTATLLGVAAYLAERRSSLRGNVKLLFQAAEEVSPGGAKPLIEAGVLKEVDAVYGVHLWTPFPSGHIYTRPGPFMAAADEFQLTILGRGGHGGLPHQTTDSILIASHLVVNLQSIVSRNIDPTEAAVISVGAIKGGAAFNVIAERTSLLGTVRTFEAEVRDYTERRIQEVAEATCAMFGAQVRTEYKRGYPPVVNSPAEAARALEAAERVAGRERTGECGLIMAGEDFAYYLQERPGCFVFIGAGKSGSAPHHHPMFDIDENAMLTAALWFIEIVHSWLAPGQQ